MKRLTWGEMKKQMEQANVSDNTIILIPVPEYDEGTEEPSDVYFEAAYGIQWEYDDNTDERGIAIC